jgi:hypothetical protein
MTRIFEAAVPGHRIKKNHVEDRRGYRDDKKNYAVVLRGKSQRQAEYSHGKLIYYHLEYRI